MKERSPPERIEVAASVEVAVRRLARETQRQRWWHVLWCDADTLYGSVTAEAVTLLHHSSLSDREESGLASFSGRFERSWDGAALRGAFEGSPGEVAHLVNSIRRALNRP